MTTAYDLIDNEVKTNDVVLFMKGTPNSPQCGFSGQVVQILDYLGLKYKGIDVLTSDELRQGVKSYSNWPTIPQLYIKSEFIGGCDIVKEMFHSNELQNLLKEKTLPLICHKLFSSYSAFYKAVFSRDFYFEGAHVVFSRRTKSQRCNQKKNWI